MFKISNKDPRSYLGLPGVFNIIFEQILHIDLVFPLMTMIKQLPVGTHILIGLLLLADFSLTILYFLKYIELTC